MWKFETNVLVIIFILYLLITDGFFTNRRYIWVILVVAQNQQNAIETINSLKTI